MFGTIEEEEKKEKSWEEGSNGKSVKLRDAIVVNSYFTQASPPKHVGFGRLGDLQGSVEAQDKKGQGGRVQFIPPFLFFIFFQISKPRVHVWHDLNLPTFIYI
jgi:hypothetical protein